MIEGLQGKRLLFLGAVRPLCEAVQVARTMGIYTIVIDYLPNSPAKAYADKACLVSTTDVEAVVELCKQERVDGIFTGFTDSMLPYARKICDRLGLPFYASQDQIRMSLDKRYFKAKCLEFGVPVPGNYSVENLDEIEFPVIVKPVDSSGGRGIRVCNNRQELETAYAYAMQISPGKNVLIEEYVTGDEITATYTMKDGEVSLSCLKDKLLSHDHPNITSQGDVLMCPSSYLQRFVEEVDPHIHRFLKGMGATDGTVFFQGVANRDKFALFELGYRVNGACDYRHVAAENKINFLEMMIAHALTGKMGGYELSQDNPFFSKYILTFNIWAHGGTIGAMSGLEQVLQLEHVVTAEYLHVPGDTLKDDNTLSQRAFRALISAKKVDQITDVIRKIQTLVKVTDTEGRNMCYSPFDTGRLEERYVDKE